MGKADGADAPERRSSLPFAPVVWPDCAVGASLIQSCESHGRPADQCGPQDGHGCDGVGDIPRKYGQRPHRLEWRPHRSFRNAATALAGAPPRGRYWPVCCLAGLPCWCLRSVGLQIPRRRSTPSPAITPQNHVTPRRRGGGAVIGRYPSMAAPAALAVHLRAHVDRFMPISARRQPFKNHIGAFL
jgi:hypothetical protein